MSTAEIRIEDGQLLDQMMQMRIWLDRCQFEPSIFRYFHSGSGMVVRIAFPAEAEARAFATEFEGRILP
ncbi:MAG: hypothetical protein JO267_02680 [Alphaproteobacteria bacterium]|nr:hypothetical protein [Alphaproteobacteria bacterium]